MHATGNTIHVCNVNTQGISWYLLWYFVRARIWQATIANSLSQICKVQENCFQLWCSVLLAIPNSKINLKCAVFSSKDFREEWHARFEARGIDRDRVNLMTHVVTAEGHLSAYNMVRCEHGQWWSRWRGMEEEIQGQNWDKVFQIILFLIFSLISLQHDISLDSFPYNGTTTTVESLLMGVPVCVLVAKYTNGR